LKQTSFLLQEVFPLHFYRKVFPESVFYNTQITLTVHSDFLSFMQAHHRQFSLCAETHLVAVPQLATLLLKV